MVLEMKIIKEELRFEENLKKRLEFICEFSKVTPTFINGSIRKIDKTNISYIEPHKVIIKNITFQDAGISAKTGNYRPEFERLKEDIKSKKNK